MTQYCGPYTGRMNADPATQWFLDDAKRQGLSVREYEAKYRIILLPSQHAIASHEMELSEALGLRSELVPGVDGGSTIAEIRAVLVTAPNMFARAAALAVIESLDDNEIATEGTIDALLLAIESARSAA